MWIWWWRNGIVLYIHQPKIYSFGKCSLSLSHSLSLVHSLSFARLCKSVDCVFVFNLCFIRLHFHCQMLDPLYPNINIYVVGVRRALNTSSSVIQWSHAARRTQNMCIRFAHKDYFYVHKVRARASSKSSTRIGRGQRGHAAYRRRAKPSATESDKKSKTPTAQKRPFE